MQNNGRECRRETPISSKFKMQNEPKIENTQWMPPEMAFECITMKCMAMRPREMVPLCPVSIEWTTNHHTTQEWMMASMADEDIVQWAQCVTMVSNGPQMNVPRMERMARESRERIPRQPQTTIIEIYDYPTNDEQKSVLRWGMYLPWREWIQTI